MDYDIVVIAREATVVSQALSEWRQNIENSLQEAMRQHLFGPGKSIAGLP